METERLRDSILADLHKLEFLKRRSDERREFDKALPDLLLHTKGTEILKGPDILPISPGLGADRLPLEDQPTLIKRIGSIRGVKNGVRGAIGQLQLQRNWKRNYSAEDQGKVVVYLSTLGVIRKTWEKCRRAIMILEQNGDDEKLERWNECGILKSRLQSHLGPSSTCSSCYGFGAFPCEDCRGGKKSSLVYIDSSSSRLNFRCAKCDASGLQVCTDCIAGYKQ